MSAGVEYHRAWRASHPDSVRRSKAKYRREHPDRVKADSTLRYQTCPRNRMARYKANAKQRGLEFSLDPRHFEDLITDRCYWCGAEPAPFNGVDRMDNSRGYVEDNVVTACGICNQAKHKLTADEFRAWILRASAWQQVYPVEAAKGRGRKQ